VNDEQLAELKASLKGSRYSVGRQVVSAVIARMEAAENWAQDLDDHSNYFSPLREVWLKTCGK
jgi:hypothetical protein